MLIFFKSAKVLTRIAKVIQSGQAVLMRENPRFVVAAECFIKAAQGVREMLGGQDGKQGESSISDTIKDCIEVISTQVKEIEVYQAKQKVVTEK